MRVSGRFSGKNALVALGVLGLASCSQPQAVNGEERGNVTVAAADDVELQAAEATARATLTTFIARWRVHGPDASDFRVKVGLPTDDGRGEEYLWMTFERVADDGSLVGRLSNNPIRLAKLKAGSQIEVDPSRVADWTYFVNGKMYGQYTGRASLKRMPPDERAQMQDLLVPTPLEPGVH